jgi:hypothetical protein
MTQGRIDPKIVTDRLALIRECLADLRALPATSLAEFVADRRKAHAADSLLRRSIEALFDTARHVLAKQCAVGALEDREVARKAVGDLTAMADAPHATAARLTASRNV